MNRRYRVTLDSELDYDLIQEIERIGRSQSKIIYNMLRELLVLRSMSQSGLNLDTSNPSLAQNDQNLISDLEGLF